MDKGGAVSGFAVGDEVYYAGELERPGSNAEYQAVDERLVGRKPKSIGFAEAAALPLTSITAWELLFDRFGVREGESADLCWSAEPPAGWVRSLYSLGDGLQG